MKATTLTLVPLLIAACGAPPATSSTTAADSIRSPDTSHCRLISGDDKGGRIIDRPRIVNLFWGGFWNDSSASGGARARDVLDRAWRFLANNRLFYSVLIQYGVTNPGSYGGMGVISSAPPATVTESNIRSQIQSWIDAHPGDDADSRTIYVVYLPRGVTSATDAAANNPAHHDHFFDARTGSLIVYASTVWVDNADALTLYSSHEVYEAIGNPSAGRGELCDPCQTLPNRGWHWNNIWVERVYSDKDCACVSTVALPLEGYNLYTPKHDYVWRNQRTGEVGLWQLDAGRTTGPVGVRSYKTIATGVSPDWQIVGTGDFDGDGNGDLLWANAATGQAHVWRLAGPTILDSSYLTAALPSRLYGSQIKTVGDFDGDGLSDVVWRDDAGTVDVVLTGAEYFGRSPTIGVPPVWTILGTGDFDADGRSDILWRNSATGGVVIWFMSGEIIRHAAWVDTGGLGLAYQPTIGRVFGGNESDIVWRSLVSGDTVGWQMNAETVTRRIPLPTADLSWDLVAAGDIDGDFTDDLVWHNNGNGSAATWLMSALNVAHFGAASPTVPLEWTLVGTVADGTF